MPMGKGYKHMAMGIKTKSIGVGHPTRNTYGKYGHKLPKGEFMPKGGQHKTGKGTYSAAKRGPRGGKQSYDQMSGSQYRQKY